MWRVSSSDGTRWVQWDASTITAQPAALVDYVTGGAPVEVAVMSGQWYTPSGPADPVAVFLRARNTVGSTITGSPPDAPSARGGRLPGLVA